MPCASARGRGPGLLMPIVNADLPGINRPWLGSRGALTSGILADEGGAGVHTDRLGPRIIIIDRPRVFATGKLLSPLLMAWLQD